MNKLRPHRFPPIVQVATGTRLQGGAVAQLQASYADGFQEGLEKGYSEGYEKGLASGRLDGQVEGRKVGAMEGRRAALALFETLGRPVDAMLESLTQLQQDYQSALRKEVVELVAKVARQVIRCELTLQPGQLLALVDETLAAMPPTSNEIEIYLNPEELERIRELNPKRARNWTLLSDSRLELGECRVKAGGHEADAGCRQRLEACIQQVSDQLLDTTEEVRP